MHTTVPSLTYTHRYIDTIRKVYVIVFFHHGKSLRFTQLVWGGLRQGSIGYKKNGELTADEKCEHEFINSVHVAKAKLAVVQRKIAASASCVARVVARLSNAPKVARERAVAAARQ